MREGMVFHPQGCFRRTHPTEVQTYPANWLLGQWWEGEEHEKSQLSLIPTGSEL